MTRRRIDALGFALAASLGTAACAGAAGDKPVAAPPPAGAGVCDAAAARFVVGERFTDELAERARTAAGAASVRAIPFGLSVPMVFEAGRLTLQLDKAGRVESVSCS